MLTDSTEKNTISNKDSLFQELLLTVIITFFSSVIIVLSVFVHISTVIPFIFIISLLCVNKNTVSIGIRLLVSLIIFQNITLSIFADYIPSKEIFSMLQGINFFFITSTAITSAVLLINNFSRLEAIEKKIIRYSIIIIIIAFFYFLLGVAKGAGFTSAAIYVRNLITPVLLLIIGLYVGKLGHQKTIIYSLISVGIIASIQGLIETFFPIDFYEFINAKSYMNLKREGLNVFSSALDVFYFYKGELFNFPLFRDLGLSSRRLLGPNMHGISFAYLMVICSLVGFYYKQSIIIFLSIPPLMVIGAKGSIILFILVLLNYTFFLLLKSKKLMVFSIYSLAITYAIGGVMYGYATQDYHVIGFLGGVNAFISNPIGHGLGMGGNLSQTHSGVDWQEAQHWGLNYGTESSIGVLLYQIGVATFIFLYFYFFIINYLLKNVPKNNIKTRFYTIPLSLFFLIINGIFQEEAYTPFSLGLLSLVIGAVVASSSSNFLNKINHA